LGHKNFNGTNLVGTNYSLDLCTAIDHHVYYYYLYVAKDGKTNKSHNFGWQNLYFSKIPIIPMKLPEVRYDFAGDPPTHLNKNQGTNTAFTTFKTSDWWG